MAAIQISQTDEQIHIALWDWLTSVSPAGVEIFKGDDNRVPQPGNYPDLGFIVMQKVGNTKLSTNETSYTDDQINSIEDETQQQFYDYSFQLDVCGINSSDLSRIISILFRSDAGCRFFEPYGIQPLYSDDPKYSSIVNGEDQYEQRWTMTIHLQFNPTVSMPSEFSDEAMVATINVDATYPLV